VAEFSGKKYGVKFRHDIFSNIISISFQQMFLPYCPLTQGSRNYIIGLLWCFTLSVEVFALKFLLA